MKRTFSYFAVMLALVGAGSAHAAKVCGELRNAYGPFDYRKAAMLPEELNVVERNHFTSEVEQNMKGSTGTVGSDLDYTLRAWPNHPRALATMARQSKLEKSPQVRGAKFPVECYFMRAVQFAPDDGAAHTMFGSYLNGRGKTKEAMREFLTAVQVEPENPTYNYNAGLAFFQARDYDKALMYAHKAYSMKFPLPGLKKKLIAEGKWRDLPAAPAAAAEAPAVAAPATTPP